jgi:hypothetical protein
LDCSLVGRSKLLISLLPSYAGGNAKGIVKAAEEDLKVALPEMIKGLRNQKAAHKFDYADDPLFRFLSDRERELAKEASTANMIRRLRHIFTVVLLALDKRK